jgi:hypothetical protein
MVATQVTASKTMDIITITATVTVTTIIMATIIKVIRTIHLLIKGMAMVLQPGRAMMYVFPLLVPPFRC